jgi:hypothetical protein
MHTHCPYHGGEGFQLFSSRHPALIENQFGHIIGNSHVTHKSFKASPSSPAGRETGERQDAVNVDTFGGSEAEQIESFWQ